MAHYNPNLTMLDARAEYFDRNNFKDGGYNDAWVNLKVGPIPFGFPNTKARVRAVKLHDLHHVLTEYDTTWTGEAEIGAWEIASGCADHYAAWLLNMGAFAIGLTIAPGKVYRAFIRGRSSLNLYRRTFNDELLAQHVGELRTELRLGKSIPEPSLSGKTSFYGWAAFSVAITLLPYIFVLMIITVILIKLVGHRL
jgi:hypothetical protein